METSPEMDSGERKKEVLMKKQMNAKKLTLQRETVANLEQVSGALAVDSQINDTVYHPQPSDFCTRGCPQIS